MNSRSTVPRPLLILVMLITWNSSVAAQTRWEWTSGHWKWTTHYNDVEGYADRPDDAALQSIRVEWQQPELDRLGNVCTVRGRLVVPAAEGAEPMPIRWFQGVTVYLAQSPNAKPDWSAGMNEGNTVFETDVVNRSGEFEVHFDLEKVKHRRAVGEPFQFGIALADHNQGGANGRTVVWTSEGPAIATSLKMLEIPAAPKPSKELELINSARGWPFSNPNGVALIRVVNALQPLGKETALQTLEEFLACLDHPKNFHDEEIVFWIIRVLFEPIDLEGRIPPPLIAVDLDERSIPDAAKWPLNPMAIVADIPFMLGSQIGGSGQPEHPSSHIDWARRHGVIRDAPLKPSMDPRTAASMLMNSHRFGQLDKYSREKAVIQIGDQAAAMIENHSERPAMESNAASSRGKRLGKITKPQSAQDHFHWDADTQQFVAMNRDKGK